MTVAHASLYEKLDTLNLYVSPINYRQAFTVKNSTFYLVFISFTVKQAYILFSYSFYFFLIMFIFKINLKHIIIPLQDCIIFNLSTTIFTLKYIKPIRLNGLSSNYPFVKCPFTD